LVNTHVLGDAARGLRGSTISVPQVFFLGHKIARKLQDWLEWSVLF